MIFLILGLIFTVCKWQEIGPIAAWSWWTVLAPYALAVLWWAWADYSGYTKNVEVKKLALRKQKRINRHKEVLGFQKKKR